jgi:hypothetical protein
MRRRQKKRDSMWDKMDKYNIPLERLSDRFIQQITQQDSYRQGSE